MRALPLVGFSALIAGTLAACGGSTAFIPPTDDAGVSPAPTPTVTAPTPPPPTPKPFPGPPPDAGPPDAGPSCPPNQIASTPATYDQTFGFALPAAANPAVCTVADIAMFKSNFTGAQTWNDLVKNLPANCASCILTPNSAAAFGVIVTLGALGQQGFVNYGACYAEYTLRGGASAADATSCGKAINYTELCIREACDCAGNSDAAQRQCTQKALGTGGACRVFSAGMSACRMTSAQETFCNSAENGVSIICGGGG